MLSSCAVLFGLMLLISTTMADSNITPATTVVSMLGMIPQCSVPCVLEDLFTSGGCPMTTAKDLAACACANITIQASLSTCVQKSCGFQDQNEVVAFASNLCEAYPKESRAHELKTISIGTIAIAAAFLLLRLYSRWLKTRRLWCDDAYAILAAVLLITVSVIILEMSLKGFGLHYWNVPTTNAVILLKLFYVCQMLYVAVQIVSKIAILALYSRLFPDHIKWFRWSVRGMFAFMIIHGLVFLLLVVFQCLPISAIWDKTVTSAKCLPVSAAIGFTGAGLSILEDIIILLLPLPVVWKLQMNLRKKIGVIFLISVGSFALITSIVRLKYLVKYSNSFDSTWDNVDVIKWSLIEILSACICGNLLPLRPLLEEITPSLRSMYSWYSDRRSSQKSSEKSSGELGRSDGSNKPKFLPTFHFTRVSKWDWNNTTSSDQNAILHPRTPTPAYFTDGSNNFEEDFVQDLPVRNTPTAFMESQKMESMVTSSQMTMGTDGKSSRSSQTDLMPPSRDRENRISGPWSRAFALLDRR
ncbi:hypothetical protein C7974DRAFT_326858 [Boeremia exigua]|uniref:uncharacterized protein n=1 Tax=Boeremia exigua TaxID=749465 RepID=UPI001E8CFA22|nr:uncharacterized protein C7974DRAFT_326858 [Boeremia exigua]KAH6642006.1 hypothetical protein C7974DRAFT_326858 [Boeremia exigua]